MKFFIVFAALFAVALATPAGDQHGAEILKNEADVQPDGYHFASATSDGTSRVEEGYVKDVGTEHEALVVKGAYSYVDEKTGQKFDVTYTADENGFQPKGDHLPQPDY